MIKLSMRNLAVLFGLILGAFACSGGGGTAVFAANPEVIATVSRLHVRHPSWGDIVAGKLTVRGSSNTLVSADLECFSLHVGDNKSKSIWVDSHADIARGDYPARSGEVSVAVYWPMKDFKTATDADLHAATLSIDKPSSGSCFEFEPSKKRS